jgi:hypothetical protein
MTTSVKNLEIINVLNYGYSAVSVQTKDTGYLISPVSDNGTAGVLPLSPSEVEYINSNSLAFKVGLLRFEKDIEEEVYTKLLRIYDWKNILTLEDIKEILIHPTLEGLTKIINITNELVFDMVRGIFVRLKNQKNNLISLQVEEVINKRWLELRNHQTVTSIVLEPISEVKTGKELEELKERNRLMQEQMEIQQKQLAESQQQMLAQMEQVRLLMAQLQNNKVEDSEKVEIPVKIEVANKTEEIKENKRGRKPSVKADSDNK